MDFRQFRYFVVTAELLHFARAAEQLGIAQPALSQQIKALETQLGARLFHRAKRRVELTEAGEAFLQEARAALDQADRAVRIAQDVGRGEAGQIDIGFVGSVMYEPYFPRLLKAYRTSHPGVRLALHEMPILPQIDGVYSRQLDLAIVRTPVPPVLPEGLESFTLTRQKLMVALPSDHPLASAAEVELPALAGDAFLAFLDPDGVGLGQTLLDLCRSGGFEPRIALQVSEVATLVSLVAAGLGVSFLPETISHLRLPGMCYVPLAGQDKYSELRVVQRRFERSPTVRALLDEIRSIAVPA